MFKNYFISALRNILKEKKISVIRILGLTIGFAGVFVLFLYVFTEISFDRHWKNSERIYRLVSDLKMGEGQVLNTVLTPPVIVPEFVDNIPEVKSGCRVLYTFNQSLKYKNNEPLRIDNMHWVDSTFFNVLDCELILGNVDKVLSEPNSMVICESLSAKIFGNENPIGEVVLIKNIGEYTITGLMKDTPENSHLLFDILCSNHDQDRFKREGIGNICLYSYLLLEKGADVSQIKEKMNSIINKHKEEIAPAQLTVDIEPISKIHLYSNREHDKSIKGDIAKVNILSIILLTIIVVITLNYNILNFSSLEQRYREIGIRKIFGSNGWGIFKQFMIESFINIFFIVLAAFVSVYFLLDIINSALEMSIRLDLLSSLFFGILFIILMVIISAIFPAFYISKREIPDLLAKSRNNSSQKMSRNTVLVVFQYVISIILITFTLVIEKQVSFIHKKDPGYNVKEVVVQGVNTKELRNNSDVLKQKLLAYPEIVGVTACSNLPDELPLVQYGIKNGNREGSFLIHEIICDYDFVDVFDIVIKEGRNFSKDFKTDLTQAVLVNESLVRNLEFDQPIGKTLKWNGGEGVIIGVIKDFHIKSLHYDIEPLAIRLGKEGLKLISMKADPKYKEQAKDAMIKVFAEIEPDTQFQGEYLITEWKGRHRKDSILLNIILGSTSLMILLSSIGLLGVSLIMMIKRRMEIGIRKVAGASSSQLMFMLLKVYLFPFILATIISWPISYYLINYWTISFSYKLKFGYSVYVIAALVSAFLIILVIIAQVYKASKQRAVDILKCE